MSGFGVQSDRHRNTFRRRSEKDIVAFASIGRCCRMVERNRSCDYPSGIRRVPNRYDAVREGIHAKTSDACRTIVNVRGKDEKRRWVS